MRPYFLLSVASGEWVPEKEEARAELVCCFGFITSPVKYDGIVGFIVLKKNMVLWDQNVLKG